MNDESLQARVEKRHLQKLELLSAQTGLKKSFLIRQLIDAAVVEPAQITVRLSTNANSDVNIRQDSHVAAAA